MTRIVAVALVFALFASSVVAGSPSAPIPASYKDGRAHISEADLRAWVGFLASPELTGRESGTPGYDIAARYVASELARLGLQPRGDNNTFFQDFDLVRRERDEEKAILTLRAPDGAVESVPLKGEFAVGDESGRIPCPIDWKEPWVFVGHGDGPARDASDVFSGIDWSRHVALILAHPGNKGQEDVEARRRGVKKIIVIADERARKRGGVRFPERVEPPGLSALQPADVASPPTIYITDQIADRALARMALTVKALREATTLTAPLAFDRVGMELVLVVRETRQRTRNVIGALPGSDPTLAGEHVALGAHLDHVGTHDGKIHFGADDDASGVSAVLGAAVALGANPIKPKRSVLFLFFAAEEKGLLGSEWFAANPTVPLDRVILQVQLDMVGRDEEAKASDKVPEEKAEDNRDTLHVVGSKRHSLELDPWVHAVNAPVGLRFEYDEEDVYERSDQYSFGKRGVPVVFFFSGFHADYHQPTDTPDRINFSKLLRVTQLVYALAFEVADRSVRLRVNRI